MKLFSHLLTTTAALASATILQNGQVRETHFLDTKIATVGANASDWKTYGPNATQLAYKGRWDSKYISWWAAPGLKFGFTGSRVAITFGRETSPGVLVAYRLNGMDWQFTNVSASSTHMLISSSTPGLNATYAWQLPLTLELRVTNWAYGIQISRVHVEPNATLIAIPPYPKRLEFIGDSLAAGMYSSYETLSGFAYLTAAGLGNVEYSLTAYPGICLVDVPCWGNPRGQTHQFLQTSDTSWRATQLYGDAPEPWDFNKQPHPDIVIINIGTNDNNTANNVSGPTFQASYTTFISTLHTLYPSAQIVLMSLWSGFSAVGSSYYQSSSFRDELLAVYAQYAAAGYVHYFDSGGILQHNDIAPLWHPTDVGHVKVAAHLLRWLRERFGADWAGGTQGPEVLHESLYWNDESGY